MTIRPFVAALCFVASLSITTLDAHAAESAAHEAAYGAGAAVGTILYVPFKTAFCVTGGVTSVLALPFGGTSTAGKIATAACSGTWVISPRMVQQREPVRFIGGGARPLVSAER